MSDDGGLLARSHIHRALSRPTLILGADRELVLVTGLAAVILIFVLLKPIAAVFGIALWIVVVGTAPHDGEGRPSDAQSLSATYQISVLLPANFTPWRRY